MTRSALDLVFGDDDAELIQVQEGGAGARRQPPPYVQNAPQVPSERPKPRPAPSPQQKAAQPRPAKRAIDLVFEDDAPEAPAASPQIPVTPADDAPALGYRPVGGKRATRRSMYEVGRDYVMGNRDPAYEGVSGFSDEDGYSSGVGGLAGAKMLAGNDDAYGNIIKRKLGENFMRFEQDRHGQKVLVFRDTAGTEQKRYVNAPGLDWQDVDRAIHGTLPYLGVGGAINKLGLNLGGNMLMQGAGAATTRYATDTSANLFMGSSEPVDWGAAGIMGVAGAGGALLARPAGAVIRRGVVNDVVDAQGNLTPRGIELARRAGLDADALTGDLAREFAEVYAKTGSAQQAGVKAGSVEFGIPVSRGQMTKDPQQLLNEKNTRAGLYGPQAKEVMDQFDRQQVGALHDAALGTLRQSGQPTKGPTSIAETINPSRGIAEMGPEPLGRAIREGVHDVYQGAKGVERQAWDGVGDAYASKTALADLPTAVQGRLKAAGVDVDEALMPASKRMGEMVRDYMSGKAHTGPVPEVFGSRNSLSVDEMRRRLLAAYNSAAPKSADQKAAKAIYDAYDDWLVASADALVTTGRADAVQFAASQRIARDVTKDIKQTFEPTYKGRATPQGNIIEKVLADEKGASAEGVVHAIFGAFAKTGAPKDGVEQALTNLKYALNKPEWAGSSSTAWNDIRLAYWMRLVQDKQGNVYTPQVMLNNIQNAMTHQGSVLRILYEREEQQKMLRFAGALRHISWKDPNPSGTGTAIALQSREFATTMMKAIGWQTNGPAGLIAATALNPIRNQIGAVGARSAVSQGAPKIIDPNLAPYVNSLTQGGLRTDLGGQPYAD